MLNTQEVNPVQPGGWCLAARAAAARRMCWRRGGAHPPAVPAGVGLPDAGPLAAADGNQASVAMEQLLGLLVRLPGGGSTMLAQAVGAR